MESYLHVLLIVLTSFTPHDPLKPIPLLGEMTLSMSHLFSQCQLQQGSRALLVPQGQEHCPAHQRCSGSIWNKERLGSRIKASSPSLSEQERIRLKEARLPNSRRDLV